MWGTYEWHVATYGWYQTNRGTSMLISQPTAAAVDFNRRNAPSQRRTFRPWLAPIPPSSALPAWHWWFAVSRWEGPWVHEISLEEGGVHIVTWFTHIYITIFTHISHDVTIFHHLSPCKLYNPMGFHRISWGFLTSFRGSEKSHGFSGPRMPGDVPQFRGSSPACPAGAPVRKIAKLVRLEVQFQYVTMFFWWYLYIYILYIYTYIYIMIYLVSRCI